MFQETGVLNVGGTQILELTKHCRGDVIEFAATILVDAAVVLGMFVVVAKQTGQHLIYNELGHICEGIA